MLVLNLTTGDIAIVIGDSIAYGWNANPIELNRWFHKMVVHFGAQEINTGQPGAHLQVVEGGNYYDPVYTPNKQPQNIKKAFINLGTNDVKDDPTIYNVTDFKSTLIQRITTLIEEKGFQSSDIVLSSIYYLADTGYGNYDLAESKQRHLSYNAAIKDVAKKFHTAFIDVYGYLNGLSNKNDLLDVDGIHYNNLGHQTIADFYINADYTPLGLVIDQDQVLKVKHGNFVI